jgi:hypothetical protein
MPVLHQVNNRIYEQKDTEPAERPEQLMHFFFALKKKTLNNELFKHI